MGDHPNASDELVVTRVFDAPRELVFRCLVEPEHLARFWGPAGTSTPAAGIRVDLRPGGEFEAEMVSDADGSRYRMRVVYTEVSPPERLVWVDQDTGVVTESSLTALDGTRTEVRVCQRGLPEAYRTPEARAGFVTSLDRFAAHLATLAT